MRIGNKSGPSKTLFTGLRTAFLIALGVSCAHVALAADATMMAAPAAAPTASNAAPTLSPSTNDLTLSAGALPAPGAKANDMQKNVSVLEDKTTENARNLVKSLDGTDALTLEDLNRARQTVARIEAMIDVEKRLGELEKLRNERNGTSSLANFIPASALNPKFPPMTGGGPTAVPATIGALPAMANNPMAMAAMPHAHMAGSTAEISRVSGAEGKYSAVLKMPDGEVRTVRAGDTVNGTTVRWISASAVGLEDKGGETKTLRVKNIDTVYSASR